MGFLRSCSEERSDDMTDRVVDRNNVRIDDCSEEQSSDKTGLDENRNKVRERTLVRD